MQRILSVLWVLTIASSCLGENPLSPPVLYSEPFGGPGSDCTPVDDDPFVGCSTNCSALQLCLNKQIYEVACKDVDGTKPFCNPKTKLCQEESCTCTGNFVCTSGDGLYPDPFDCRVFHSCVEGKSTGYKCLEHTVYDPKYENCQPSLPCSGLCKDHMGKILTFPRNRKLYIKCSSPPRVMKCRGDNVIYNPSTGNCEFVCKQTGLYPDSEDEHKFYVCTERNGELQVTHSDCPPGTVFNSNLNTCI